MDKKRPFKKFERSVKKEKPANSEESKNPSRPTRLIKTKKPAPKNKPEEISISNEPIRLNKYIANAGVCSRRDADKLIEAGEITVNGKVVTEMGHKVTREDEVKYGKKKLNPEKHNYILLNKPRGFITTTDDPQGRRTVMELIKTAGNERVYPVGRLDRNTSGLLLFTNDGDLAKKLSHPSHKVRKLYQAELDKPLTENHYHDIREGLKLEDGVAEVDDLAIVSADKKTIGIDLHIGKNRIVRRIFEHLGYEVLKLDRTTYASLTKKDLSRGKWRNLTEKEIIKLKHMN